MIRNLYIYLLFYTAVFDNLGKNIFEPLILPDKTLARFFIEKYDHVPCRIQYRGLVKLPTEIKYVFYVEDTRLLYLACGQRSPEGFSLKQVNTNGDRVTIEDFIENREIELILGQNIPMPGRFDATIYDQKENKRYSISDKNLILNESLSLKQVPSSEEMYIFEKGPISHCRAYKISLEEEQKIR